MHKSEFEALFRRGTIRAWFDWDRALAMNGGEVVSKVITTHEELGEVSTCWYMTADDERGDWRDPTHRRQSVKDAAMLLSRVGPESTIEILELTASLSLGVEPPTLMLPAALKPNGKWVLLDGNHRAIAAYLTEKQPRVLLLGLNVELDPTIMPDIVHDLGLNDQAEAWASEIRRIESHFAGSEWRERPEAWVKTRLSMGHGLGEKLDR